MKQLVNNRFALFLLFLFIYTTVDGQVSQTNERDWRTDRQKIKIISYNIMNGFSDGTDKDRINRFTEWVKEQLPDVLALQELCSFNEAELKQLAATYGHSYVAIVKEEGYPVGITSKHPLEVIEKRVDGYGHGLLHCKILDMDFLVTHLNPSDWRRRKQEADNMVQYINQKQLTDCLLMGDLNAHSPFDALLLEKRSLQLRSMIVSDAGNSNADRNLNGNHFEYAVISTFMSASLHDICRMFVLDEQRYSYPTRILVSTPKGDAMRQYQERLDYIFVSDNLRPKCVDAYIYNGPENDYLSDHYPVGISLLIPKK